MIKASDFIESLKAHGYTHVSGVPCSFLKPFINYVIDDPELDYVGATSEGEAVTINFGAYLGGRKTVTICQNSGFGNMVNPLTSLNHPFRVPTLLIPTWRGGPSVNDEPQHELMGEILPEMLDTMEIPWEPFPDEHDEINDAVQRATSYMETEERPYALIMSRGTVERHRLNHPFHPETVNTIQDTTPFSGEPQLTRTEAIREIVDVLHGNEIILGTTGKTGRELYAIEDRENQLYVVGGMGCASAIGFGLARNQPDRPVLVLDGDGAALMKMGNMATIGAYGPENLIHILLDNESHDSTGGQSTVSPTVNFAKIAANANYRRVHTAENENQIKELLPEALQHPGPALIHLKIKPGSPENLPRPDVTPEQVKTRLMTFLKSI